MDGFVVPGRLRAGERFIADTSGDGLAADVGPLKDELHGLYLGIGRDEGTTVESNGIRSFLSMLDRAHSLNCLERYVRLEFGRQNC
jgi:hypothetical protein